MKIFVKGNFFIYIDSENNTWIDNCENAVVWKNTTSSTSYNIFLKSTNQRFTDLAFSSINDESGSAYASQSVFEDYMYQNTGIRFQQPEIVLDDLTDVTISAPSNGQIIEYNSTTAQWENVSPSGIGGDMMQSVYDADGDGVVDSAERLEFIGKNSTGVTIAKTKVVYISGATGQKPNITLADASLEATSSKTIGITRESIANNADGYVITHGTIHNINTASFTDGDALWLSETAGDITATIPAEPAHSVFIGYVAYAHATNGKIILHIQNGYELDELHGVKMTSDANDDILQKKAGLWVNRTLAQLWVDLKDLTVTLTNKTLSLGSNTISGTKEQFDTACTDGDFAYQSDLSAKQNTITGGATTITSSDLTASKALISNASGKVAVSSVTDTELGYLSGVTSSVQTQIDAISGSTLPESTPHETFRGVSYRNNSTTEDTFGGITISTTGSATARSVATTNYATKQVRKGFVASVVSSGRYTETRGSALLWYVSGGFRYVCDVYISDTAYASGCRQFYGMMGQTSSLTYSDTVLVDTMVNVIGFGSDSADTNIQVFHNDATGTCTKIDLGSSFPANRSAGSALTAMYSFELYNDYSGNVLYKAVNNETGVSVEGTISTNLPLSTQGLNFVASRCMGGGGGTTNSGQFDLGLLGVYSI
jgi:hypothetical protein